MTLHDLADALAEVRRYVRSQPEYVEREVERLEDVIREFAGDDLPKHWADRLEVNLIVGRHALGAFNESRECVALMNPEILEGYLDGAVHEIRQHARAKEGGEG